MNVADKYDAGLSKGRWALGPAIAFLAALALSVSAYFLDIPAPYVLPLTGAACLTAVYGVGGGVAASVVAVAFAMFTLSEGHDFVSFSGSGLRALGAIALCAAAAVYFVGRLRRKYDLRGREVSEAGRPIADGQSPDEAALTDALTGARNRHSLRRDYGRYENRYLHVMVLDLDNFKRVNDTYGHAVGDYILKKAGQQLAASFGAEGCYRYGGDEFLVICADMDDAVFADRLNTARQGLNAIHLDDKRLPARFSAGYVYGDCEYPCDLRLMMHQAGDCLRRAKGQGRDRWVGRAFDRDRAGEIERRATGNGGVEAFLGG